MCVRLQNFYRCKSICTLYYEFLFSVVMIAVTFIGHVDKMLAETRMKLRNAESSIAFLQTQHAEILQGLHAEIQTLQQKCARKLRFCFVSHYAPVHEGIVVL